jgi:hypothetical protein
MPPTNANKPQASVEEVARGMRGVFERLLDASIGRTDTDGACLHASILLAESLIRFTGAQARVCGGGPPLDGGARDPDGAWRGHYWVEGVRNDGTAFVADITADQFGWPKVVVLSGSEAAGRYRAGDARLVDAHVAEFIASLGSSPSGEGNSC